MKEYKIYDKEDVLDLIDHFQNYKIKCLNCEVTDKLYTLHMENKEKFLIPRRYKDIISSYINSESNYSNELIFGKNPSERVVSIEVLDNNILLFKELPNGEIVMEQIPNKYWILADKNYKRLFKRLDGDLHYQWALYLDNKEVFDTVRQKFYPYDTYSVWNDKEAAMIYSGVTYFKGMKVQDVSVLSFDLETTSLDPNDPNAKILIIANTFRKNGKITRKMFTYDDYKTPGDMIKDWVKWVREMNPSVMTGHNIYGYDFPYLSNIAEKEGITLDLGRDGSQLTYAKKFSKFRKDGSQSYDYKKIYIFGREIIDGMYLAIKYDIKRKYISYGLKQIIEQEGWEVKGRQHYDASKIRFNYKIEREWKKIKEYAKFDADDSLTIYDKMIDPFFYMTQSVPKPFQDMLVTASGSQLNSIFVRGYLQNMHSLPKADERKDYEGAISLGIPGIYKHALKVDISAMYPSIIMEYQICNRKKDPKEYLLEVTNYVMTERLKNKQKAKETGDSYYDGLQQSMKIFANSIYGFLGSKGLLFNSPEHAAMITRYGREILERCIKWATGKNLEYWRNKA
jgi:DNA polymerase elongation subunit (family B)